MINDDIWGPGGRPVVDRMYLYYVRNSDAPDKNLRPLLKQLQADRKATAKQVAALTRHQKTTDDYIRKVQKELDKWQSKQTKLTSSTSTRSSRTRPQPKKRS